MARRKPADTNVEEVKEEEKDTNIFKIVLNFINEIFDKFLKFIDDLINDML